jgi:hypothetical protein
MERIGQTDAKTINPLSFPQKTIELAHFINPGFRPAILCYHGLHLLTEGFNISWIGNKAA